MLTASARAADANFAGAAGWTPISPWLSIEGIAGYALDNAWAASRAGGTLFAPLAQDQTGLLFLQLDGRYFFDPGAIEGSAAVGTRWVGDGVVYGLFGSYDVRYSADQNFFQQITVGGEALAPAWDARANVYLPLTGAQTASGTAEVVLSGSNIAMVGAYEVPLWGFDAEVGGRLASSSDGLQELWAHAGGYYFNSWDMPIADNVYGPQVRAEYRINDVLGPQSRLSLVASAKWDEMRGAQFEAGARLRIPLGANGKAAPLDPLRSRLAERIVRDPDIVLGQSAAEQVRDALTDVVFEQVEYTTTPGDLGADVAAAPANTLLIVDRDYDTAQTIDDAASITVAGEGGTFAVAGVTSGVVLDYTVPGARHAIAVEGTGGASATALTVTNTGPGIGEGVHLVGLDVSATNDAMADGANLIALDIDNLVNPFYLEDMTAQAVGQLPTPLAAGTSVFLYGLRAEHIDSGTGELFVLDSDIGAAVTGGLDADGNYVEADLYGLFANSSTVTVDNSNIHANLDGGVSGGDSGDSNALVALYALSAAGSTIVVTNSTVTGELNGTVQGGGGGTVNTANVSVWGLHTFESGLVVENSNIDAAMTGDIQGGMGDATDTEVGNVAHVEITALSAGGSTQEQAEVEIRDSNIHALLTGDVVGGNTGTGNAAVADVYGLSTAYSTLTVDRTDISATLKGDLRTGAQNPLDELNNAEANIYGLSAGLESDVSIAWSDIDVMLIGDLQDGDMGILNATRAMLNGLFSDGASLTVDGATVSATLVGNVAGGGGEIDDASSDTASVSIAGANVNNSTDVTVIGSEISALLAGNVTGGAGSFNSAVAVVTGFAADTSTVSLATSMVDAVIAGDILGGDAGTANFARGEVYGVAVYDTTLDVSEGSSITANLTGNVGGGDTGANNTNSAEAIVEGLLASNIASDGGSIVSVDSSNISAGFDGDIELGTANFATATLRIVDYGPAPASLPVDYALSVTDSDLGLLRIGTDMAGTVVTRTGVYLGSSGNAAPVELFGNTFAGTFDGAGNDVVFIGDANYDFGSVSTGNFTTTGTTTNTPLCSDGGVAWAGSFEVDTVDYDAAACSD